MEESGSASGAESLPPLVVPKRLAIPEDRGVALSQARRVSIGLPCSGTAGNRPPDASGCSEPWADVLLAIMEENRPCSGTAGNRPPDASGCSEPWAELALAIKEESMPDIEDIEFMSPGTLRAATAEGLTT